MFFSKFTVTIITFINIPAIPSLVLSPKVRVFLFYHQIKDRLEHLTCFTWNLIKIVAPKFDHHMKHKSFIPYQLILNFTRR